MEGQAEAGTVRGSGRAASSSHPGGACEKVAPDGTQSAQPVTAFLETKLAASSRDAARDSGAQELLEAVCETQKLMQNRGVSVSTRQGTSVSHRIG